MAMKRRRGTTPFERFRNALDERDVRCPDCGHEGGGWEVLTDGAQVRYRHDCPRCDSRQERRYALRK